MVDSVGFSGSGIGSIGSSGLSAFDAGGVSPGGGTSPTGLGDLGAAGLSPIGSSGLSAFGLSGSSPTGAGESAGWARFDDLMRQNGEKLKEIRDASPAPTVPGPSTFQAYQPPKFEAPTAPSFTMQPLSPSGPGVSGFPEMKLPVAAAAAPAPAPSFPVGLDAPPLTPDARASQVTSPYIDAPTSDANPFTPRAEGGLGLGAAGFGGFEGRQPAPPREPMSAEEAALRGAEKGATLGFGDEIRGAMAASTFEQTAPSWLKDSFLRYSPLVGAARLAEGAQNLLLGQPDAQQRYDATVAENRELQRRAAQDQPLANFGGELGGAVASGVAMPFLAPFRAVQGANLATRGAVLGGNLATTGAVYGGVAGFGVGEGGLGNRLTNAGQGAATGAVLAPVVGAGVLGAGAAVSAAKSLLPAATGPRFVTPSAAVNLNEFRRLNVLDSDVLKLRPGEASAAVELQGILGGQLARRGLGEKGDFIFTGGPYAGKIVDFMFTPGSLREVERMNHYFDKAIVGFPRSVAQHAEKADIIPMDSRFLSRDNRSLLFDAIKRLPEHQQNKIIIYR